MSEPPDNHTMNACMARVIGKEVRDDGRSLIEYDDAGYFLNTWDPIHNPIEMEEVEAWVVRDYNLEYARYMEFGLWDCHIWKDGFSVVLSDPDKKRAFALAIYQMEQSQNGQ